MEWFEAAVVEAHERADEEHGCAGSADEVCEDCANGEDGGVHEGRGRAADADEDVAGDDEEAADQGDE